MEMSLERVNAHYLFAGAVTLLSLTVAYRIYNRYHNNALEREFRALSDLPPESVAQRVDEIRNQYTLSSNMDFELSLKCLASCIDRRQAVEGLNLAADMERLLSNHQIEDKSRSIFFFYQSILQRQKDDNNVSIPIELLTKALQYAPLDTFKAKLLSDRAIGYFLQKDYDNAIKDIKEAVKWSSDPAIQQLRTKILEEVRTLKAS